MLASCRCQVTSNLKLELEVLRTIDNSELCVPLNFRVTGTYALSLVPLVESEPDSHTHTVTHADTRRAAELSDIPR